MSRCFIKASQMSKSRWEIPVEGGSGRADDGGGVVLQEAAQPSRDAAELLISLMDKLIVVSLCENEQPRHLRFPMRPQSPGHQGHTPC